MTTTQDIHSPDFLAGDEFTIPTFRLLQQDGTLFEGAEAPDLERDKARRIYQAMVFTRVLDERMMAAQRQGRLSFYMQCTGEEAAVIGATAALDDADMIMAQYREQGALAYRGFTFDEFMNQLFGNELDYGKGRQMPIHYGSRKLHYMTISSPLATQIPQATGYAYGQKLAGDGHCTTVFFGEGAASEGDFHAALNMAAVHKVPVIFFCRNNGYAISTPAVEQFAADGVAPRAFGYRMHVIRVDGNDILAVYQATREARRIAVEDNQPVLIEAMTYRLAAHSSSDDPSGYRSKKEEEAWREKDPILRMRHWLNDRDWWSEDEEKELQERLRREVLETMKRAEKRPPPPLDSLVTDVYADVTPALQRQLDHLKTHIRQYPDAYPRGARSLDPDVVAGDDAAVKGGE
ncbi:MULTISPECIES: thiamine pyrophosphate-dependent dehydrogenase E1 component subunit alpha [Halomonas]|uniref:2-oxoisovalerate dehydrogenase subunit alpha n=1 Tax=Halomonas flagellata TaxID=2920385 RepID=A0ABS9RSD3_9GAMM|nr:MULTISPECIES: thiamine pyrophosphate-dependent dehydrogenase E1 component subunit alpha [Halomonas]MCH4562766.1 thiamine pyrophosphate-dependent dehydrogenase E1 component subunit alpha [Halomonas flagellata]PXX95284.1 3-methyl-2-oxobutanoate dehydrogenase [Halomonas sp. LBP4]